MVITYTSPQLVNCQLAMVGYSVANNLDLLLVLLESELPHTHTHTHTRQRGGLLRDNRGSGTVSFRNNQEAMDMQARKVPSTEPSPEQGWVRSALPFTFLLPSSPGWNGRR